LNPYEKNVATHFEDEEQLENLKRWWSENWKALAAGLVIGFGAIGGWEGWKAYQNKQSLTASQMYEDLKKALAASNPDEARQIGDKLQNDYAGTPYAAVAALRLAQQSVQAGALDEALARLGWVAQHADDDALEQLARLRQARVLWQQSKPEEALELLDGEAGDYEALYQELRGDIAYAKGDRDAARSAYEAALKTVPEQAPNRPLLQQKLDDLAVAEETVKS
jgi:predicted negative regulator of RcsB-dependent stress response